MSKVLSSIQADKWKYIREPLYTEHGLLTSQLKIIINFSNLL